MNVSLDEHRLGGLRWIVLRGPDREAFRALGEHTRAEITALTQAWPLLARLRKHACDPPGITPRSSAPHYGASTGAIGARPVTLGW